jgi:hypothetical protein
LKKPVMDGIEIEFSKETKYLGVVLDNKLRWAPQIKSVKERATKVLMQSGGRTEMGPATGDVELDLHDGRENYGNLRFIRIWWQRTELKTGYAELQKVQRLACLLTTGAMKSAPTIVLETFFFYFFFC